MREKRKNGLSLSMGNKLSAPLIVLQLFCIICLSTLDNSVDILTNETDCKVLIKTTQTYKLHQAKEDKIKLKIVLKTKIFYTCWPYQLVK